MQGLRFRSKVANTVRNFWTIMVFWISRRRSLQSYARGCQRLSGSEQDPSKSIFALPQSPQLFKQILMAAGMDRYYQIAKCFRDEDLRADRQPEFTQIDIETSFMDEGQIMEIMEDMIKQIFRTHLQVDLGESPRLSHADAMRLYGSDKPDLRIDLQLVDIEELMRGGIQGLQRASIGWSEQGCSAAGTWWCQS